MSSQKQNSQSDDYAQIPNGGYLSFQASSKRPKDPMGLASSSLSSSDDTTMSAAEQAPPLPPPTTSEDPPRHVMMRMPNTAFGISMGLAGNAILWKSVENSTIFNAQEADTEIFNITLWLLSLLVASWVAICYLYKCCYHHQLMLQEWRHPVRIHFMNTPHLIMLMLALGLPNRFGASQLSLEIVFGLGLLCQTVITQFVYEKWLFNPKSNITCAQPPFLLSTVGWFLLANLGISINVESRWGLAIPQFCLGIGGMFYLLIVVAVMNGLHMKKQQKGSPALTLLLAPPAVGVIAMDALDGDPETFSTAAGMTLGWILVLFLLFARIGPSFAREPGVLGEYWAYVFPLAAVATAWIRYASVANTTTTLVIASVFMSMSIVALLAVIARMGLHCKECIRGRARWGDPLIGLQSQLNSRMVKSQPNRHTNIV